MKCVSFKMISYLLSNYMPQTLAIDGVYEVNNRALKFNNVQAMLGWVTSWQERHLWVYWCLGLAHPLMGDLFGRKKKLLVLSYH